MKFDLNDRKISEDGKYVLRTGKIFQAGNYPDKKFNITNEEIKVAAKKFTPVNLKTEHTRTVWDGKIGRLEFVEANDSGELYGGALIPRAVDEILGGEYKVSAEWSADKELIGLGIVVNPRVKDAALFTASFSEDDMDTTESELQEMSKTWDGRSTIQQIHDICARHGAICDPSNVSEYPNYYYSDKDLEQTMDKVIEFVSKEESESIQKLHDLATQAGARCSFIRNDFSQSKKITLKEKTMAKLKDLKDALLGVIGQLPDEVEGETSFSDKGANVETKISAEDAAKIKELEDKVAEFSAANEKLSQVTAELEALKNAQVAEKTQTVAEYVKGLVGKKILPAQQEKVTALFSQLLKDDESNTYTFSEGDKNLNRLELAKLIVESFADIKGTKEVTFSGKALGNTDTNSELEALRLKTIESAKAKNAASKK